MDHQPSHISRYKIFVSVFDPLSTLHDTRALKIFVYKQRTLNEIKYTLLLRRAINSNSRGLNYLHGSLIYSSVNFNNRKVKVKNAILSRYNSLDLLRRWFNDEVIKESRRSCRDIKRASTSRTRRCARSLEELLIEIEKKKENRGREEAKEEKKKGEREREGKKEDRLDGEKAADSKCLVRFSKSNRHVERNCANLDRRLFSFKTLLGEDTSL